jgi:hypothetical protein
LLVDPIVIDNVFDRKVTVRSFMIWLKSFNAKIDS